MTLINQLVMKDIGLLGLLYNNGVLDTVYST